MSKLEDIINDAGATSYCAGQDWEPGDDTHARMDKALDEAVEKTKELMLDLGRHIKDCDDWLEFNRKVKEL